MAAMNKMKKFVVTTASIIYPACCEKPHDCGTADALPQIVRYVPKPRKVQLWIQAIAGYTRNHASKKITPS
jgi:hypothetical protein